MRSKCASTTSVTIWNRHYVNKSSPQLTIPIWWRSTTANLIQSRSRSPTYLFCNYNRVTPTTLVEEEQKVLQWVFDPNLPIVLVFNKVDSLMDLSSAAGVPYTAKQLINFAYVIINKTGKFATDIR